MNCDYCGNEFTPKWKGNRFCCRDCSQSYIRDTMTTRTMQNCIVCGKEFLGENYRKSKYCSMECRNVDWHNSHKSYLDNIYEEREKKRLAKNLIKAINKRMKQLKAKQLKAKHIKEPTAKKCAECGCEFIPRHWKEIYCSDKCRSHHKNANKDKRIYINGKPDLSISLTKLYMRDLGVCALCGRHIDFDCDSNSDHYPSIDHIVPLSKGGFHSWDNVQLACRICNTKKRDKIQPPLRP